MPLDYRQGFAYVDEVWANSNYDRNVIARVAPSHVPVVHIPVSVEVPKTCGRFDRQHFGLDDRIMFLFMFDHHSTIARKNPVGLIEAYREAFDEQDGAALVLKSINGARSQNSFDAVQYASEGRRDILLIDGFFDRIEANSLLALCDVYVSLHRSEGLGFTMAEAMLLGRPVIASSYGGNVDFMDNQCAVLVSTDLASVACDAPPYLKGSTWAQPDLKRAAAEMRRLAEQPEERRRLGRAAASHSAAYFNPRRIASITRERLNVIWSAERRR
jgi:glycosyltransferase involved in cell wall biosynthesis